MKLKYWLKVNKNSQKSNKYYLCSHSFTNKGNNKQNKLEIKQKQFSGKAFARPEEEK